MSSKFEVNHQNEDNFTNNSGTSKNKVKESKKIVGEYIDFEEID